MNDEIAFMKSALTGDFGWVVLLTAWQGLLRTALGFFNSKLKEWMEQALPQDKPGLDAFLQSRSYRLTNFIINALLSVKLPSTARKPSGNTETFTKPGS